MNKRQILLLAHRKTLKPASLIRCNLMTLFNLSLSRNLASTRHRRFTLFAHQGEKVTTCFPLITKFSILVIRGEPMLLLDLLGLNLFLPQRVMVAGTIKIDNVIDVLEDRLRRS
jgi:hypothetical protein